MIWLTLLKKKKKKKKLQSNVYIPDELIAEIISLLSVKNIVLLKCVSKSWNILISDPTFVQKHHKISSQNPRIILIPPQRDRLCVSFPVHGLLENPSSNVSPKYYHGWVDYCEVIGTYKGLLCLLFRHISNVDRALSFLLWNPATRTKSGAFRTVHGCTLLHGFQFSFGCDISTGTYKVVAFRAKQDRENQGSWRTEVRILNLRDNSWRNIESFSSIPIIICSSINRNNNVVHLSGKVNWLTVNNNYGYYVYGYEDISHVEKFAIVSLDLSTETYTRFLLPSGFDDAPHFPPTLHVLMDCLCFSHDFKRTKLVIWQMKEFGVQESWTQLFRIDYINLHIFTLAETYISYTDIPLLFPLYLSKNGDKLILAKLEDGHEAIIYDRRDNRVAINRIYNNWFSSMDYVESLILTY